MSGTKLNTQLHYNGNTYVTPEMRARKSNYADPLMLNFKLMIDYSKPYGLFADEKITDSALGYLKRMGETTKYELLKTWISRFQSFIKNYDFLILSVDGLDIIANSKPHETFTENDKLSFTIRETSDMFFQSLLTSYRHIWYDDNRGVEVLPANLRRFDVNILVYSAGYYNMVLYDNLYSDSESDTPLNTIERKIYPTIKKLSEDYFIDNGKYEFNHHIISLGDAQINNEDSGKSFFGTISNEMSGEGIKNNLTLNFRFAQYSGTFNNIFGEFDFVKLLALSAATDRFSNEKRSVSIANTDSFTTVEDTVTSSNSYADKIKNFFKEIPSGFMNERSSLAKQIKTRQKEYINSLSAKTSPIGNALSNVLDPNYIGKMIGAKVSNQLDKYGDLVGDQLTKIQNLVYRNFSDPFIDYYVDKAKTPTNVLYRPNISGDVIPDKINTVRVNDNMKLDSISDTTPKNPELRKFNPETDKEPTEENPRSNLNFGKPQNKGVEYRRNVTNSSTIYNRRGL